MSMFSAIRSAWALLFGLALLMAGNGLQGTLLGVRASIEGFSTQTTGFVMTGYYVGFLLGSILGPKLVKNVGHIRVFAALASILSAAMLLHSIFVEPITWFAIRVMNGFAVAGLYLVVESWLNDAATNRTRGQLLSVYMVILLGGMAAGQFLLNVADPAGFELFILVSVLVSLSLVPISLSVTRAPKFDTPSRVSWRTMYESSPLGVVGCFIVGIAQGALLGMGAVYANEIGMGVADVSLFMAMTLAGGMVLQWPIGRLSDIFDRRVIITAVTILAAIVALVGALLGEQSTPILLAAIFVFGGLCFSLYSLCIAHSNDHLQPEQMVAASGTLILVGGLGASAGPALAAALMSVFGPAGFFWCLCAVHAAIGLFALYRMTRRAAVPTDEQTVYQPMPVRATPLAANITQASIRDHRDRDLARWSRF
ncbi:MAG: MFS transporter [Gammaproteobacteria bacterium]|nr:MFS transporter [Gammaproteobacteria bacterium]MDX2459198.1 MFS transporter [Gammaproteobacteria bacterium]